MSFTVVIATRNNEALLASTLASFSRIEIPCKQWKLIVVNNGSRDQTERVLREFSEKLPLISIDEPIPGKNRALNRAIRFMEGQLVVFTDDDVIPDGSWLRQLWNASLSHREYAVFGGHIRGCWPGKENPYGLDEPLLGGLYALTSSSIREGPMESSLVGGPNMAVRTAVFEAGNHFNESIGPNGTDDYPMGSDTSFTRLLEKKGYRMWFVPEARVQHVIRPYQLERKWILGRAKRAGRGRCREEVLDGVLESMPTVFGYPRWALRRLVELKLQRLLPSHWTRDSKSIAEDWKYSSLVAYLVEAKASLTNRKLSSIPRQKSELLSDVEGTLGAP